MASGTINGSTNNQYIKCKIEWTSTKNVSANTSSVTAKLYYWRTNTGYRTYGAEKYTLTINGLSKSVERSYSEGIELTNSTPVLAHTFTTTVSHNADGKKSITIKATGGKTSGSFTSTTCSGTATLDTIPRKSTLSVSNGTLGTAQTLTITEQASAFTHKLYYTCGSVGTTYILGSSSGTSTSLSTSWTPPLSLANQNTTGTSVSIKFTLQTYNGSTLIGSNSYTKTFSIPSSVVPAASMTVSEAVSGITEQFGAYVKSQSKLQIALSGSGSYGSTIKSYKITANGKTYTTAAATTDFLTSSGTNTITGTVTDSRGRTKSVSKTVTVLDYAAPSVTSLSAVRCDEDGTANEEGSFAKVTFSWKISDCGNQNTKSASVTYKKRSDTSWQNAPAVTLSGYTGTTSLILSGINTENIYDVMVTVRDYFYSGSSGISRATYVPTAFTLVDYRMGGHGIAFGKVAEEDLFDVNLKSRFRKGIYLINDTNTEYGGIHDNGTSLWFGGSSLTNPHNTGYTTISAGGYDSAYIAVFPEEGDGTSYQIWHKGMTFKSLWSGSWSSGSITVAGFTSYHSFMVQLEATDGGGTGTLVLAFKHPEWNYCRGVGGYMSEAGNYLTYHFAATTSGNTLTFVNAGEIFVNNPSNTKKQRVIGIYGIL